MNQINISILSSDSAIINSLSSLQKTENIFTICGQYRKYENIPLKEHPKPALFFIDDSSNSQSELYNFLNIFPDYYSETKTIVYTENLDKAFLKTLLSHDVRGIINKIKTPAPQLKNKFVETIKLINSGSCCFDNVVNSVLYRFAWMKREIGDKPVNQLHDNVNDEAMINAVKLLNLLTSREMEILKLISQGKKNKNIADVLCISTSTVEQHKHHIIKKLKLNSSDELTRFSAIHKDEILKHN